MQMHWNYEPVIPTYESLLLQNAMSHHNDAYHYYPLAMAKRIETGTKYRFLCIAQMRIPSETPTCFTIIEVYKPELGKPYVTRLFKVEFSSQFQ